VTLITQPEINISLTNFQYYSSIPTHRQPETDYQLLTANQHLKTGHHLGPSYSGSTEVSKTSGGGSIPPGPAIS
jgi:hypothetical protein